jgi:seryl-tRNA synthetase
MLDLILIRPNEGGNPQIVYESQKKRYKSTDIIDKCMEMDKEWKKSKLVFNN